MEKLIVNHTGSVLCNTLPYDDCEACIAANCPDGYAHITCHHNNMSKRIGTVSTKSGTVKCCDGSSTTTRNFKNIINEIAGCVAELNRTRNEVQEEIKKQTTRRIERLIHNLRNNNAHSIQNMQTFVPEEMSRIKVRHLYDIIARQIDHNRHEAVMTFLRMLKHIAEYKAELTVYDILNGSNSKTDIKPYKAYDLVKVVFHEFNADFKEKNIYVDIGKSYDEILIDYDTFKVALYYLFENAVKYTRPDSTIRFEFIRQPDTLTINMHMTSILVSPDELGSIFQEGYSGEMALRLHKEGSGIGLYRARKLFDLNSATITFEAGTAIRSEIDGIQYTANLISVTVPTPRPATPQPITARIDLVALAATSRPKRRP